VREGDEMQALGGVDWTSEDWISGWDAAEQLTRLQANLAAAKRVAEEAMRLLTPEQLAELRGRLDALEAGNEHGDSS
jgi:hypothetical protein